MSRMAVLADSLKNDFLTIKKIGSELTSIYDRQIKVANEAFSQIKHELEEEEAILRRLNALIGEEGSMQGKIKENLQLVRRLEHSELFRNLMNGMARLISFAKFNLTVIGQENIPLSGPVIIAPRHFHGDNDPVLFSAVLNRKLYYLAATDWMKEGIEITVIKTIHQKYGAIPINRPDSIFEKPNHYLLSAYKSIVSLLMLNQAVVVFPEGYPQIDRHARPESTDPNFMKIKLGVFHFVDYVQKKKGIEVPIIPIGTNYSNLDKFRINIVVVIGKPMFIPIREERFDYEPYRERLQGEIRALSEKAAGMDRIEEDMAHKPA